MKNLVKSLVLVLSLALNVWGIMSLLHVIDVVNIPFLAYLDKIRLILRYVVIVVTMTAGIMSFNMFAGMCKGKVKNALSIGVCTYSTVLTVPLFLTFVFCFFAMNNISTVGFIDNMITPICRELQSIFTTTTWQYVIFSAGTLMGIIFLAVPIIMCVSTVKGGKKK